MNTSAFDFLDIFGKTESNGVLTAESDPVGWVSGQLFLSDDYAFECVGEASWISRTIKDGHMLETVVSVVDGNFVDVETTVNIVPDEREVVDFRIIQMVENGKFVRRGYKMAQAGEKVAFGSRQEVFDGFDLNGLIGAGISTVGKQASCFRSLKNGDDVEKVYWNHTQDHALTTFRALSALADD